MVLKQRANYCYIIIKILTGYKKKVNKIINLSTNCWISMFTKSHLRKDVVKITYIELIQEIQTVISFTFYTTVSNK